MHGSFGLRAAIVAAALAAALAFGGAAARANPASLVITYRTTPANWLKLRKAMRKSVALRLATATQQGLLSGFRLFYNREADAVTWSGMAILDFSSEQALERFHAAEHKFPAALDRAELALTSSIETAECETVRGSGSDGTSGSPLYLIIPYRYVVSEDAYRTYLDHYTVPQLHGWMKAGILSRYQIDLATFPAARPWSALLVLRYRGAAGLARRDAVKTQVRAALAHNPDWKTFSENKAHIRDELTPAVAELLASTPPAK